MNGLVTRLRFDELVPIHRRYLWLCCSVTAFFSVPVIYTALTFLSTKPLNSITTITDAAAHRVKNPTDLPDGAIPPIADLDLTIVNRRLYLNVKDVVQ